MKAFSRVSVFCDCCRKRIHTSFLRVKSGSSTYFSIFMTVVVIVVALQVLPVSALQPAVDEISFMMWKPDHPEVWDSVLRDFERKTGIKVHVEIGPHSTTAAHALITQKLKNADPHPDVFMMDVIWPAEFVSAGWLHALDDFFTLEEQSDFFSAPILACTFDGRIYGVPFETSGGVLYYRKDLLQEYGVDPPETWDRLVEVSERIINRERIRNPALHGYSGQFKQYEGLVCNMQEFVLSNQGSLFDAARRESTINSPQNLSAVRYVRDRIIGKAAFRGVLTYEEPESLHVFVQGHAVFLRDWPYAWEIANNPEKSRVAGKVDMTVLPHFSGGESVSTLGGWQFAVSRFSKRKELATKFISYMASRGVQKTFAIYASQTPARRSVYRDPEVLQKNPHFSKLREILDKARPRPAISLYPAYSNILQSFYQKAIVYPDSDIELLAIQADGKVRQLLRLMKGAGT